MGYLMQDKPVTPLRFTDPICQISMLAGCILRFLPDLRTWDLFVESEKEMKANLVILRVVCATGREVTARFLKFTRHIPVSFHMASRKESRGDSFNSCVHELDPLTPPLFLSMLIPGHKPHVNI